MTTPFKLLGAALALSFAMAAAAPAAIVLPGPDTGDRIARACYNAAGMIVPCKIKRPKF